MSVVNPYEQNTWLEKCTRFELVHFCGVYLIFSAGVLDFFIENLKATDLLPVYAATFLVAIADLAS